MRNEIRNTVRSLREGGRTYNEIRLIVNPRLSKSTIACWCKGIKMDYEAQERLKMAINQILIASREMARMAIQSKRRTQIEKILEENRPLVPIADDVKVSKLIASILYLAEGTKKRSGKLTFCNSDSGVIKLFLYTLRRAFIIDESKFRCTLQCRADQNTRELIEYWSKVSIIPVQQFYKTQIDPRSIGKPTRKVDYMGVCRIDYLSSNVYDELMTISRLLTDR